MNYEIIKDENELQKFIDFLPDLEKWESFYISLFSRKKYDTTGLLTNDKSCLKRVTATKDRIIQKLRQMECKVGSYEYKGQPIPQETLAVYITPNPRDLWKSGINTLKDIAQKISDDNRNYNPKSLALDNIQTTSSRKIFFDVDVDMKGAAGFRQADIQDFTEKLNNVINEDCYRLIETRGGVHCLVQKDKIEKRYYNTWYKDMVALKCSLYDITMNGDGLVPCCGCTQGNYTPILIK